MNFAKFLRTPFLIETPPVAASVHVHYKKRIIKAIANRL